MSKQPHDSEGSQDKSESLPFARDSKRCLVEHHGAVRARPGVPELQHRIRWSTGCRGEHTGDCPLERLAAAAALATNPDVATNTPRPTTLAVTSNSVER